MRRAIMICSECTLDDEVEFITWTLCNNGFPEGIVRSVIRDKIFDFSKIQPDSVQRCPVYLRFPWFGDISDRFDNQISACVRKCYFYSSLCVVFCILTVLTSDQKDVLPTNKVVLWFILVNVFAVCSTSRKPMNVWIQELNNKNTARELLCWPNKQHVRVFHCRTFHK